MDQIICYFSSGDRPSSRGCEGPAVMFVRVKATGRLCPLCRRCLDQYEGACRSLSEKSRAENEYSLVPLGDGAAEYAAQLPTEEWRKQRDKAGEAQAAPEDASEGAP